MLDTQRLRCIPLLLFDMAPAREPLLVKPRDDESVLKIDVEFLASLHSIDGWEVGVILRKGEIL
jgi:hypothetical protein